MSSEITVSADDLLEVWGLRVGGAGLRSAGLRLTKGGEMGIDEAAVVMRYVEATEGFEHSRPALAWVFCEGRSPDEFPLLKPGLSFAASLFRLGWGMYLGVPRDEIARMVIDEFRAKLQERMRRETGECVSWK